MSASAASQAPARVPFAEAFRFWLKLGFVSFGGPTGQIAIMHQELVERRRWISEGRFLHALNYCMVLPGPEATQLAAYIGWLMRRTWGGIVAGTLFFLPSAFILAALSWIYLAYGEVPLVAGIFYGIKPAGGAIVLRACPDRRWHADARLRALLVAQAVGVRGRGNRHLGRRARRARGGVRLGRPAHADGLVFHQGGAAHLRRRLRGAALRVPVRSRALRLAERRADDRRPGAGRDHTRSAHHGGGVRRLRRRLDQGDLRRGFARARRRGGGGGGDFLYLPALVRLHLLRRAVHRDHARQPEVHRAARRDHSGGGRRSGQPGAVLRVARALAAGVFRPLRVAVRSDRGGGVRRVVPLQGADHPDGRGLRAGRPCCHLRRENSFVTDSRGETAWQPT